MAEDYSKVLLVEGRQEVFSIPELMEANGINWGTRKKPTVYLRDCQGCGNIDADTIIAELQASNLAHLGIVIDADDFPQQRWQSIRDVCLKIIPDLPLDLPETGLICHAHNGVKFGIWMMPDNRQCGMLETFLAYLLPDGNELLWEFSQEITKQAKKDKGAAFKDVHQHKADIHTWLAWQNPPGRQLHQAVMERILDPKHPKAQIFVNWFRDLYDLHS